MDSRTQCATRSERYESAQRMRIIEIVKKQIRIKKFKKIYGDILYACPDDPLPNIVYPKNVLFIQRAVVTPMLKKLEYNLINISCIHHINNTILPCDCGVNVYPLIIKGDILTSVINFIADIQQWQLNREQQECHPFEFGKPFSCHNSFYDDMKNLFPFNRVII